ncbi:hypothetical protein HMPREF0063_11715 [Aeromicrobium marinum DSM 15272]|uniref:DUF4157 domain-containing protein n=1 Tax=Aeromicrobium marinum DSM 15272 TaxID=585531 RepID=E2SDC9_9ACTN|nr:hypothetical protein [Aeromicrobium marinum]EFQ82506.1 hypothetical protein HMPREF0063_11715 [Aeromicrobium marinum DSM 15272]
MRSEPAADATRWTRVRAVVNAVNGSTALGLLVARAGGATPRRQGRGVLLATGHRWGFPRADAFTVGNVVISRRDAAWWTGRETLLRHEDRHCTQYAWSLGPVMLPLYGAAAAVSWVLAGDHASYNPFERLAGLDDGGYRAARLRRARRR